MIKALRKHEARLKQAISDFLEQKISSYIAAEK